MVVKPGLPNRLTDSLGYITLHLLDNARYRRDEHCSSVIILYEYNQMNMIRHDNIMINIY